MPEDAPPEQAPSEQAHPEQAPDRAAREFAASFSKFLDWVHATVAAGEDRNPVAALVADHLGPEGTEYSVVTRDLPPFEHVNLQAAIDAWSARPGRTVEVRGMSVPSHFGGLTLQNLVAEDGLPPVRLAAPALIDLPNGPGTTLGCLRFALLLITDDDGRYVLMIQAPSEY
jgi:hypothetical protein